MPFSSFHAAVLLLLAALFCRMFGVFLLLPVAAPLAAALPDSSALLAALVLGGYGLTQAALQIPLSYLADRVGKKPVMLGALALFAAGGFVAAAAESVHVMVGGRLLQGAGAVAAITAAWMVEITPAERRVPAMAGLGGVIALAFLLALFAAPQAAAALELNGVFALSGWLGVAAFACVLLLPTPPIYPPAARNAAALFHALHSVLDNHAVRAAAGGAFLLHAALAVLFFTLPKQLPLPPAQHWEIYALAFAFAGLPAWRLINRIEQYTDFCRTLAVSLVTLGLLGTLLADWGFSYALFPLAAFFAGFIVLEAALPAFTARGAPLPLRTTAMGVMMSCQFAGMFCGAALAGWIAEVEGVPKDADTIAILVVMFLFLLWNKLAAPAMDVVECPSTASHKEE